MKRSKKGFTLVELVIVIAVIAILSAILIPTFGNVLNDANRTAAALNAKNSLDAYQGDLYDGYVVVFNKTVKMSEGNEKAIVLKDASNDGTIVASDISYVFKFKSRSLNSNESLEYKSVVTGDNAVRAIVEPSGVTEGSGCTLATIDINVNGSSAQITWDGAIMLDGELKIENGSGYLVGSIFLLYTPSTTN